VTFSDFTPAGNQGERPDLYEIENRALDPEGAVLAAMAELAPWTGRVLVDLGCGSGFWLPRYADDAAEVIGVEPDPRLRPLAEQRDRRVRVVAGSAEHIPLPDASVDVVHARFAYFFPPAVDAGLAEVTRVLRPGGALVVVDNDQRAGQFAELLAASPWAAPQGRADTTDAWWAARGAHRIEVMSRWQFASRDDFEAVLRLEFPAAVADRWLAAHPGAVGLTYGYVMFVARRQRSDTGQQPRAGTAADSTDATPAST
jgi:SAM-dependent methyltransferase